MIKLKQFIRMTPSINYRCVGEAATFCICITTLPFLTSCANLPANYNDPSDFCSNERQGLADHTNYFAQDIATGAAKGAILGALTGAATAIISGDKKVGKAAVVGGIAGGVAGGILGYYKALQSQQGQLPDNFFTNLITDVDEENRRIEAMNNSFDRLVACRKNQVSNIRAAFKRNETDRSTGEQNMSDLRRRVQDDLIVANSIRNGLGDRANQLQYVVDKATSIETQDDQDGEDDTGYQYFNLLDEYYAASDLDEFGGRLQYVGGKKKHGRNKMHSRSRYKSYKAMKHKRLKHKYKKNRNRNINKNKNRNSFQARLAQSHDVFQNQHQHCENNFNELTKLKTAALDEGLEQSTSIFDYTNRTIAYALNQVLKYV